MNTCELWTTQNKREVDLPQYNTPAACEALRAAFFAAGHGGAKKRRGKRAMPATGSGLPVAFGGKKGYTKEDSVQRRPAGR